MLFKFSSGLVVMCAVCVAYAAEGCDASFSQQYRESVRLVDSLHPDKAGQARVFSADGSEFTAGQARWMQGRLHNVEEACARGDQARATELLTEVQGLLRAHRRAS